MKDHETVQYMISDSDHEKEHNDEKLIECAICSLMLYVTTTDNLAIHMKVHYVLPSTQLSDHESRWIDVDVADAVYMYGV